jgi:hypothetical protein
MSLAAMDRKMFTQITYFRLLVLGFSPQVSQDADGTAKPQCIDLQSLHAQLVMQ